MYSIEKPSCDSSLYTTDEESISGTSERGIKKQKDIPLSKKSEPTFSTINEVEVVENVQLNDRTFLIIKDKISSDLKMILFEEGLKALAILYLSMGFVASVVFLSRQIVTNTDVANVTWGWVGFVKGFMSLSVVILIMSYRCHPKSHTEYLKYVQPESSLFFYTFIAITAALSWIYFLMMELRNFQYYLKCAVVADLVVPITQMLFIMTGVIAMSDIVNYKIQDTVSKTFYALYKSATILLFFNSINCLVFNFFEAESQYLQIFISNGTNDIFCYKKNISGAFVKLLNDIGPFFQVFTIIFFISSIAILLKPIQQFSHARIKMLDVKDLATSYNLDVSLPARNRPQYGSLPITCAVLAFIVIIFAIPLDIMGKTFDDENKKVIQIIFNFLPLIVYVLNILLSIYLMHVLRKNLPMKNEMALCSSDTVLIWLSLFGVLLVCFKYIINSSQYIHDISETHREKYTTIDMAIPTISIVFYIINIFQSCIQSMVLDFISNLKINKFVTNKMFQKICYPVLILISTNIGIFFTDWYLLSRYSTFQCFKDPFNQISWDLLSTLGDSFTLIFRAYCVLFLLKFLTRLRCEEDIIN